ncbi:MAG TPA: cyclase family protein [Nitrososphaeraceae archaeon]|nr:cyclase family protein [Nitrososphaeraceae archaeon]
MISKTMRVIDLTMRITPSIRVYPGSPQPSFIPWSKFDRHGYDSEAMFMSTHTGTHVDAPNHFKPGLASIDMISSDRLVCNAVMIRVEKSANQLIEEQDFGNHQIRVGDAVVIATGWEKRSGSRNYMSENPGLSEQAARYLARKRVNAVAIDSPSIDLGADSRFIAHNILLSCNILVVENLCNLTRVTSSRRRTKSNQSSATFTLIISPLKLRGATGSPARVLALL